MDLIEARAKLIEQMKTYHTNSAAQIDAFFSRVQIQAAVSGFAVLTANSTFIKSWIETHYTNDIRQAMSELYGGEWVIQIEVDTTEAATLEDANRTSQEKKRDLQSAAKEQPHDKGEVDEKGGEDPGIESEETIEVLDLDGNQDEGNQRKSHKDAGQPRLTFENFVTGASNQMAFSMAVEVADKPGSSSLNPLFIYGRSGVGKTHLLCAIKNYILEEYPSLKVRYIDSMEMVNEYSNAAMTKTFKSFEESFKDLDVLLIDDIQALQGKQQTLDTLFRIFNDLIPKGKQFVFSADRAPKNIDLDERYVSRFNSGATIDVHPPDAETKRNIAKKFLMECQEEEEFRIDLSDDVLDYLAENSSSNVRELKSAVTNVVFALRLAPNHEMTKQQVKQLLTNHFTSDTSNKVTMDSIKAAVCAFYGVTEKELSGKGRGKNIKVPRNVGIFLCREMLDLTYGAIGKGFGRSHNTIMHSYEVISREINEDGNLREEVEAIREKLRTQQF